MYLSLIHIFCPIACPNARVSRTVPSALTAYRHRASAAGRLRGFSEKQ